MLRTLCGVMLLSIGLAACIGTDLIEDLPTENARIAVTPLEAAVQQGDTVRLEATYYDGFGMPLTGIALRWESTAPGVASVSADGLVSGLAVGQAMITAHAEDAVSPSVLLTVVGDPAGVARVVVAPDTLILPLGITQPYTATAYTLSGEVLDGKTFTWASSNPEVASIDENGVALALQPGITQITATAEGIVSAAGHLRVPGRSRQGTFVARPGSSYQLSGTATLEELPSGGLRLTFGDDFSTSSGPGLEVFLSNSSTVGSGSLNVAELQSTTGMQTYSVPASGTVTLDTYSHVVIHCVPFNVTFGAARLQ